MTTQAEQRDAADRETYLASWAIVRSYGAERATYADTAATVQILDRIGAFSRSERDTLHDAGWFD